MQCSESNQEMFRLLCKYVAVLNNNGQLQDGHCEIPFTTDLPALR